MDRTEVRGLGAPSSPFARHHRAGSVARKWESRSNSSLRSLPRRGLFTPAELRRTLSRTATAPALAMCQATARCGHPAYNLRQYPSQTGSGAMIPTRRPPSRRCASRRSRSKSAGPSATALVRGRWGPTAVRHGQSAMCRIGQDLKPPPRVPSHKRVGARGLRGHLPHAAQPFWGLGAPAAALWRFAHCSRASAFGPDWPFPHRYVFLPALL